MTLTHYTRTANGRPACEHYRENTVIPTTDKFTRTLGEVTCPDCQELTETEVEPSEFEYTITVRQTSIVTETWKVVSRRRLDHEDIYDVIHGPSPKDVEVGLTSQVDESVDMEITEIIDEQTGEEL